MPATYLRHEDKIDQVHYFFPDEEVVVVNFACKVNGEAAGMISICHPKEFVEKEPLICDF